MGIVCGGVGERKNEGTKEKKKCKSKQLRIPSANARGTFQWGHAPHGARVRKNKCSAPGEPAATHLTKQNLLLAVNRSDLPII